MHLRRSPREIFAQTSHHALKSESSPKQRNADGRAARMTQILPLAVATLIGVLFGLPRYVLAGEGVIEINQAKVIAAGGFPFKIASFGSYRLTSNLTVNAAADGIDVNASYVDIDLNGFAIVSNTASPDINGTGTSVTVHDGKVLNTSNACAIMLGDASVVRNVIAFGSCGIQVGNDSRVADSIVNDSPGLGISAGNNCRISGNTTNRNANNGISAGDNCRISGNIANGNASGVLAGHNCEISGNTANGNNNDGILASSGSLVLDNVVAGNGLVGLSCGGTGAGYGRNNFTSNAQGNFAGACKNMGQNLCDGSLCP